MEATKDETQVERVLTHLDRNGVLAEAEALFDRLDAGTEDSPVVPPAEVLSRLRKRCG